MLVPNLTARLSQCGNRSFESIARSLPLLIIVICELPLKLALNDALNRIYQMFGRWAYDRRYSCKSTGLRRSLAMFSGQFQRQVERTLRFSRIGGRNLIGVCLQCPREHEGQYRMLRVHRICRDVPQEID
ncbi:MAG: hypothetical protein HS105_10930 [Chloracidobacterium sp.]|nr:hypothetical protein [Chloracidobacterium sp.]MCO5332835.1 hypothetical protein [Pyrinomonadaceae bacterium]